jgi:hypothetical protein
VIGPVPRVPLRDAEIDSFFAFGDLEEITLIGFSLNEKAARGLAQLPRLERLRVVDCTLEGSEALGITRYNAADGTLYARPGQYLLFRQKERAVFTWWSSPYGSQL